jgi:putative acetyltransferase
MMSDAGRMIVRRAGREDLAAIDRVHRAAIRRLCSPFYTGGQIVDWLSAIKPEGYVAALELFDLMVAVDGRIVGLCIYNPRNAEVTALYVSPRAAGRGVGRRLMSEVEAMAHESGIRELHLKSTLNAAGFYEHMGFARVERSSFLLPGGTELPCIVMKKPLRHREQGR